MESAINDVHRKVEDWGVSTQDGMVDLWQKCGTIDKEWRSLRTMLRGGGAASSSSSLATSTAHGLLHVAAPGMHL